MRLRVDLKGGCKGVGSCWGAIGGGLGGAGGGMRGIACGVASGGGDCAAGCLDLLYSGGLRVDNMTGKPNSRNSVEECLNNSGNK